MRTSLVMMLGIAVLAMMMTSALAADRGKGGGTRDRKRDGSCQSQVTTPQHTPQLLARYGSGNGNGKGKGDRKRDGSCQANTRQSSEQVIARYGRGNGKGNGDRKRDGSCVNG